MYPRPLTGFREQPKFAQSATELICAANAHRSRPGKLYKRRSGTSRCVKTLYRSKPQNEKQMKISPPTNIPPSSSHHDPQPSSPHVPPTPPLRNNLNPPSPPPFSPPPFHKQNIHCPLALQPHSAVTKPPRDPLPFPLPYLSVRGAQSGDPVFDVEEVVSGEGSGLYWCCGCCCC